MAGSRNRFLTPEEFAQRLIKNAEDFAKEHGVPVSEIIGYTADLLGGFPPRFEEQSEERT